MKKVLLVILTSYVGSACADNNAFYVGLKTGKNLFSSQSVSSSMNGSTYATLGNGDKVTTLTQGSAEINATNSLGAVSTLNFGYYFNDLPIRAEVAYSLYGGFSDEIDNNLPIVSTTTHTTSSGSTSSNSTGSYDVKNKLSVNVNTLMFNVLDLTALFTLFG